MTSARFSWLGWEDDEDVPRRGLGDQIGGLSRLRLPLAVELAVTCG